MAAAACSRAAYPIETVVPGWRSDKQVELAQAQALPERLLGGPAALRPQRDYKTSGHCGPRSMVGVLLLGWMAWRLSKQMRAAKSPPVAPAEKKEDAAA